MNELLSKLFGIMPLHGTKTPGQKRGLMLL